jgi:NADPH-dependent ferric siderophore reductase
VADRDVASQGGYLGLAGVRTWSLQVASVTDITPRMRRIDLTGPELDALEHQPGQDVMLIFPQDGGRPVHRRYTIRRLDRTRPLLELNVVLHGDGPAARWARAAGPGDQIEVAGPRGKITLVPGAGWHLFAGDETGVPAALAMMSALPPGVPASAFFEVDDAEDEQPLEEAAGPARTATWIPREPAPPAGGGLLAAFVGAELPPGPGHAYLAGEVGLVASLRRCLLDRGLAPEQISAKGYWNRSRANAAHGEPERRP